MKTYYRKSQVVLEPPIVIGSISTLDGTRLQFNDALNDGDFVFTGDGTTLNNSQILATDGSGLAQTLDTATYPSLTELSYVKGVTSSIQTQLGTKVPSTRNLTINGTTYDLSADRTWTNLTSIKNYSAKIADYTITSADYTIHFTAGPFTAYLPTAVGIIGQIFNIKNTSGSNITVTPDGIETIDGAVSATITTGNSLTLQSTGAEWIII